MSSFFTILLIGISLSMDAFSLSLAYGLSGISNNQKILLSIIVGIYHFIMPLIGYNFGNLITKISLLNNNFIASLILLIIGLELIISKEKEEINITLIGLILFGLSVSIDSLTVGISLHAITNNIIIAPIIFSITSLIFTYLGLQLGNVIGSKIGNYSKKIGGIVLIIIAIIIFIA